MIEERRGPGRPRGSLGRPRGIADEYAELARGRHKPRTIAAGSRILRNFWIPFLAKRGVASEDVGVLDMIAWEDELLEDGFTSRDAVYLSVVRGYYILKGTRNPSSRWSRLAAEIKGRKLPPVIGKKHPHEPYPLALVPKILEASRAVVQKDGSGAKIYSEAFAVTATFIYSGGRGQFYGLRVDQVREALKKKYLELYVKTGKEIRIPVHDRLLEIWKKHLEDRGFDGPMMFRRGADSYTYQDGNVDFMDDERSATNNLHHVAKILHGADGGDNVQAALKRLFDLDEHLTSHRFRKSIATFYEQYGFTDAEIRTVCGWAGSDIVDVYKLPNVQALQAKISKVDIGSASWVAAHDPPTDLFANQGNADMIAQLRAQLQEQRERNDRLEKKLDQVLENQKVIA